MPRAMSRKKIEVIEILNKFSFASVQEISLLTDSSLRQAYRYLEDINAMGLTMQKRLFASYSNFHWLTIEGAEFCDNPLPVIKSPSIFTLEHDIKVIRLYFYLKKQNKGDNFLWYTPRELGSNNIEKTKDLRVKIRKITRDFPDAVILKDNFSLALELENSYKTTKKWIQKISNYKKLLDQKILQRVVYYIEKEAIAKALGNVINEVAGSSEIKIVKWVDEQKSIR